MWRPGQITRIHDHTTWCVFGVLQGVEHEEVFDADLNLIGHSEGTVGDVNGFAPPGDIHRVHNTSDEIAITAPHLRDRRHPRRLQRPPLLRPLGDAMSLKRMDNVLIDVEDLEAAIAFFTELGMELEGQTTVEGPWVDRTVGLEGVRADIAMMRTPDGHGRVELSQFHTPPAVRAEPANAPANALGIRRIMFAVEDIDDVVARLRAHGGELVDEIAQYEDFYRLCFMRGPEGIIIGLAEQLS